MRKRICYVLYNISKPKRQSIPKRRHWNLHALYRSTHCQHMQTSFRRKKKCCRCVVALYHQWFASSFHPPLLSWKKKKKRRIRSWAAIAEICENVKKSRNKKKISRKHEGDAWETRIRVSSLWRKHKRVYAHVFPPWNWYEYENRLPRNWGEKSSSRETLCRVRPFPPDVHAYSLRYRISIRMCLCYLRCAMMPVYSCQKWKSLMRIPEKRI